MRILFLVQKEQRVILDRLYDSIARHADACDTRWLSSDEQANLKRYFHEQVDVTHYDRIIFFTLQKRNASMAIHTHATQFGDSGTRRLPELHSQQIPRQIRAPLPPYAVGARVVFRARMSRSVCATKA